MQQVWSPADGALLKELRLGSKIEITALARMHTLSTAQVKQLEDGGDSSFYTPAIKLATGRKLLLHFGSDVASPKYEPKQNEASLEKIPFETPKVLTDAPNSTSLDLEIAKHFLRMLAPSLGFLLPCLALIVISYVFFDWGRSNNASQTTDPIAPTAVIASNLVTPNETKPVEALPAKSPESSAKVTGENLAECNWSDASTALFGYQPSKSGDYVHLVAMSDSAICIKDSTNKSQVLYLKNAQSQTVRGRPPFEIFSHTLSKFQMYYQGNLLRLPNSDIKNIILKEQKYE